MTESRAPGSARHAVRTHCRRVLLRQYQAALGGGDRRAKGAWAHSAWIRRATEQLWRSIAGGLQPQFVPTPAPVTVRLWGDILAPKSLRSPDPALRARQ